MGLDLTATAPVFDSHFSEAVTVYPPGDDAEPYEIQAVVNRGEPGAVLLEGSTGASIVVNARNHETLGLPGATLDTNTWELGLPLQVGMTPERRPIRRLVSQDAGRIEVEVA